MSKCEICLQLQHLTSLTSVPSASFGRFSGIFRKEAKLSPGSFSASVNLFAACHQPTLDYIHLNSQRVMRIMLPAGVLTLDVCLWLPRTTNGQLPVRLSPSLIQPLVSYDGEMKMLIIITISIENQMFAGCSEPQIVMQHCAFWLCHIKCAFVAIINSPKY